MEKARLDPPGHQQISGKKVSIIRKSVNCNLHILLSALQKIEDDRLNGTGIVISNHT